MATLRTKSISTKVTEEEYAKFEALAGEQTISECDKSRFLRMWMRTIPSKLWACHKRNFRARRRAERRLAQGQRR